MRTEPLAAAGAFCTLERRTADDGSTMVAKAPRDGAIRGVGEGLGLYERERRFYAELADSVPMRVPHCFDAGDPLLIEDLGDLRPGDQVAGMTVAEAERVLGEVAALHAAHWERPVPGWLFELDSPMNVAVLGQVVTGGLPALQERFAGRFDAATLEGAASVCARIGEVLTACSTGPRTIAHGDLRVDNLLFDGDEPVYVDWQTVAHTRGTHDVAYLLSGSLPADVVSEHWEGLLRGYHATLGVPGYSWDDCLAHYRQNVLYSFVPALATLGAVAVEGDRGAGLADVIGERVLRHAAEVDAFSTLVN